MQADTKKIVMFVSGSESCPLALSYFIDNGKHLVVTGTARLGR
jgi:hypothetical protein